MRGRLRWYLLLLLSVCAVAGLVGLRDGRRGARMTAR